MLDGYISFADTVWLLTSFLVGSGWVLTAVGVGNLLQFRFAWAVVLLCLITILFVIYVVRTRQIQTFKAQSVFTLSVCSMLLVFLVNQGPGQEVEFLAITIIGAALTIIIMSVWILLLASAPGSLGYYLSGQSDYLFSGVNTPGSPSMQIQSASERVSTPGSTGFGGTVSGSDNYIKVRASFAYEAQSAEEVSFVKHEVMEVLNNQGNWWKVLKVSGEIGMAPSNYLQNIP